MFGCVSVQKQITLMYYWPTPSIRHETRVEVDGYLLAIFFKWAGNKQIVQLRLNVLAKKNYFNFYFAYLATNPILASFWPEKYRFKLKWPKLYLTR